VTTEIERTEIANVTGAVRDAGILVTDELRMLTDAVIETRPERISERGRIVAGDLMRVSSELVRVDGKTAILTSLSGAGLIFLLGQDAAKAPVVARVLTVLAAVALAASALVLLLRVLRPRLGNSGFNRWSAMTAQEVLDDLADTDEDTHLASELVVLSGLARPKFVAVRLGVDLLALAVVLMAAAILAGVIA
jgi:hypothetical protein